VIFVNEATALRPMEDNDYPFVVDSWLKSFQFSKNRRHCEPSTFAKCHYPIVRYLLEQSPRRVVACDPQAPENIQGWCVGDYRNDRLPVVHFCYVRQGFLEVGLQVLLFNAVTSGAKKVVLSHLCPVLDGGVTGADTEVLFDPYSIYLREPPEKKEQ
jgi:hypothetical protein